MMISLKTMIKDFFNAELGPPINRNLFRKNIKDLELKEIVTMLLATYVILL